MSQKESTRTELHAEFLANQALAWTLSIPLRWDNRKLKIEDFPGGRIYRYSGKVYTKNLLTEKDEETGYAFIDVTFQKDTDESFRCVRIKVHLSSVGLSGFTIRRFVPGVNEFPEGPEYIIPIVGKMTRKQYEEAHVFFGDSRSIRWD